MNNDQLSSVLKQTSGVTESTPGDYIGLSIENQEVVRKINLEINQSKFSIGDIDCQLAQLKLKKIELLQKVHNDTLQLNKRLTEFACEIGINPEDGSKWNVDLTANEIGFRRV